jgi:hypothetical protein
VKLDQTKLNLAFLKTRDDCEGVSPTDFLANGAFKTVYDKTVNGVFLEPETHIGAAMEMCFWAGMQYQKLVNSPDNGQN